MLYASHRQTSAPVGGLLPLWDILGRAGCQADALLCLDGGDMLSYPGSGQTWADRSGTGSDFVVGASASVEGTDPAFTGGAGDLTADTHWQFESGDRFAWPSAPAAWMSSLHKDNAAYTVLALVNINGAPSLPAVLFGTGDVVNNLTGMLFSVSSARKLHLVVFNGSSTVRLVETDAALTAGWHLLAVAVDEASTGRFWVDGAPAPSGGVDDWSASYPGPSAGGCAGARIGTDVGGYYAMPTGTLLGGVAVIDRPVTPLEMGVIWQLARQRLGL